MAKKDKKSKQKNKKKEDKSLTGSAPRSHAKDDTSSEGTSATEAGKLPAKVYDKEIAKLQVELVRLQEWVRKKSLKVVVVFEGRDTAGKGGMIKRITERVSPRVFRVVALPTPTEREKSQIFLQRYVPHLPAGGEVVLFDRSWYNRAGVERVMGFCTQDEYDEFMRVCPRLEETMVRSGIILIKYFLEVSQEEQARRFEARIHDPAKQWKLSPMDVESVSRWWDYTIAYDKMIAATDTPYAPWHVVQADNKKRARLNCIAHLLSKIPYKKIPFEAPSMPKRKKKPDGAPETPMFKNFVPEIF